MPSKRFLIIIPAILALSGCQNNGADLQSNVYTAGQVNTAQGAKVINILAVQPAKVEVDNTQGKQATELLGGLAGAVTGGVVGHSVSKNSNGTAVGAVGGGLVGAAAGSLAPGKVLVDGVSITYEYQRNTLNSVQVGQLCQFQPGKAIVISTGPTSTRIQPNATCPEPKS